MNLGDAWSGVAMLGVAWHGAARHGVAWRGKEWFSALTH
jgi:hypothetical protein